MSRNTRSSQRGISLTHPTDLYKMGQGGKLTGALNAILRLQPTA